MEVLLYGGEAGAQVTKWDVEHAASRLIVHTLSPVACPLSCTLDHLHHRQILEVYVLNQRQLAGMDCQKRRK
jgi:hypothetical protein